jgi:predicted HTH transcriptional regulator
MVLETKKLTELLQTDLQALLDGEVAEGKFIDYKRELPGLADGDKKEFLFDISSFANASGGYLLYGIEEENGIPTQLTGITVGNQDEELRRFQNLILDGIEPRIMGLELRFVPIVDSKHVLVIRIPKSWLLPHMVIFKGSDKFY